MNRSLSRRRFLHLAGSSALMAGLVACVPAADQAVQTGADQGAQPAAEAKELEF
ncbi:hypothetical protein KFU94_50910 [Chloroflexi bacterium TSY]|nr:hypothetical protein [Chloroflexi bacterium TSY]